LLQVIFNFYFYFYLTYWGNQSPYGGHRFSGIFLTWRNKMIKLSGILSIRVITGRNGDFRVGRLLTEIGEFAVKSVVLDQYDEGSYEGEFGVTKIFPSYYSAAGRLVVEVRAEMGSIALSNINPINPQEQKDAPFEQDPLDEEKPFAEKSKSRKEMDITEPVNSIEQSNLQDSELFGLLWPLQDQVKLDSTIDRNVFREQRDRLREMGYTFKPVGQIWLKNSH
jgi:hypothetical protein